MKELMNKTLILAVAACGALGIMHPATAAIRVDVRDFVIATGVERMGDPDGSGVSEWDTTLTDDGWQGLVTYSFSFGYADVKILVLNGPLVVGGRLAQNETWDDSRIVVVRDDVVVPSGKMLTLGAGCIVKFTEGARIAVENGGVVVAEGAYLAAFDDDSVGGDTDMNGEPAVSSKPPYQGWLDDPTVAALATVRFVDGATNLPTRTYTVGTMYGALPWLTRVDARFGGWFTQSGGRGADALPNGVVAAGETVLYAHWIPHELGINPESASVGCLASEASFTVTANVEWDVSCSDAWVTVRRVGGNQVSYAVAENANTEARTATIRVTMRSGGDNAPYQRDFTLTQTGMAQHGALTISPESGTTFSGASRRVTISGAESGAEIRYTLDGSEPTATSKLYTKSFNVFDTTVVKARAFMSGKLPSATVASRIVRLPVLAEALDVPLWTITTGGDATWTVDVGTGRNGYACARSGTIGNSQTTMLSTTVNGAGTFSFWWKVDCEDDPDLDNWDYLVFEADGVEVARIDGKTAWRQVSTTLKGDSDHTLKWTYIKDEAQDPVAVEDCGWVDQLAWSPRVGGGNVPVEWIENIGVASPGMSAEQTADLDPDGDGFTTAEEFIAGTDPTDPDSKFKAMIEMVNGIPVVTYVPDLLEDRKYIKYGKKDISDPDEPWVEVKEGEESDYNFFKVSVEIPE